MLKDLSAANIFIVCGHTDMRKSIDGLAAIVQQQHKLDLFSDSLFLFCGRRRDRLKALLWEGDGFLLFYKRLENERQRVKYRCVYYRDRDNYTHHKQNDLFCFSCFHNSHSSFSNRNTLLYLVYSHLTYCLLY